MDVMDIDNLSKKELAEILTDMIGCPNLNIANEYIIGNGVYTREVLEYEYDCYGPSWSHSKKVISAKYKTTKLAKGYTVEQLIKVRKRLIQLKWK